MPANRAPDAVVETPRRRWWWGGIVVGVAAVAGLAGFFAARARRATKHAIVEGARPSPPHPDRLAGRRTPNIVGGPDEDQRRFVPGQPQYDPVSLVRFVPAEELFANEPRNPVWSTPVEAWIRKLDRKAIDAVLPGFEMTAVECRTTICRVSWTAPRDIKPRVRDGLRHFIPGAFTKCTPDGEYYVALRGGESPYKGIPPGDVDATIAAMARDREERAAIIRRGGGSLEVPPDIVAAWPKE
jgi:hypothetical protein